MARRLTAVCEGLSYPLRVRSFTGVNQRWRLRGHRIDIPALVDWLTEVEFYKPSWRCVCGSAGSSTTDSASGCCSPR